MISNRTIRHWLRLPLLTIHEQRELSGLWWKVCTTDFPDMLRKDLKRQEIPLEDKHAVNEIIDEFADAIDWLEGLKA